MSSPETDPPAESTGIADRVDKIEDKISQIFDMLKGGGSGDRDSETEPASDEESMSRRMRQELLKLRREEEAQKKEAERDAKVEELSGKVAAIPERAPREYRKATNAMGWVTEADR